MAKEAIEKGGVDATLEQISYEYSALQQQAEQIRQQLGSLQAIMAENDASIKGLSALGGVKDSLMPIGAGVLVKVNVTDNTKVFVEVGARVMAEKPVADAITLLESRGVQLKKAADELQSNLYSIMQRLEALRGMAEEISHGHKH